MTLTRTLVRKLDQEDLLSAYQNEFYIADKELCYLDGNSLGRLPLKTIEKIDLFLKDEWGSKLVEGWEKWIKEAQISGDLLAESILGANSGEVLICDTTSVNFFQLCSAVFRLRAPQA